jgi:hypothetical protein
MREDFIEQLEKLFPEGFLIVYRAGPDHRVHKHNPRNDSVFESLYGLMGADIDELSEEDNDGGDIDGPGNKFPGPSEDG